MIVKKRKIESALARAGHAIVESARRRNPFAVVPVQQGMILNCATHFTTFFKKNVQANKKPLNIQRAGSSTTQASILQKFGLSMAVKTKNGANLALKSVW